MNEKILLAAVVLVLGSGCNLGGATVGSSETSPLVRVDGAAIPVTITDANGISAQITSGSLTAYDSRALCDYSVNLSSGKTVSDKVSCLSGAVIPITNGVRVHIAFETAGVPQGTHDYDFVNSIKPCECPKFCPCGANRLLPLRSHRSD